MDKGKMKQMFSMMMQAWGMPAPEGMMSSMGGATSSPIPNLSGGPGGGANWKGAFQTAFQRATKSSGDKDDLSYEVTEVEGGKSNKCKYQAVLTVDGKVYTGATSAGKKGAEHEAAKVAMQDMFPDTYWAATSQLEPSGKGGRGKKRVLEKVQDPNPKGRLNAVLPFLLDRGGEKGDIVYTVEELEDEGSGRGAKKYVGSVSLPAVEKTFTGEPQKTKKDAENAAATAALEELQDEIEPAERAHKEKKKEASRKSLAELKERVELKKAEKAAADEAEKAAKAEDP